MDFILDVHLPIKLSKFLSNRTECTCVHVNNILNKWHTTDDALARYADEHNLILVSKDLDFRNSHILFGRPKKLVRVSLGNCSYKSLEELFLNKWVALTIYNDWTQFYMELG